MGFFKLLYFFKWMSSPGFKGSTYTTTALQKPAAWLASQDPSVVLTNAPTSLDGRHAATCWGQAAAEISHAQVGFNTAGIFGPQELNHEDFF